MQTPLESLIASGTKLWLDSVDPELLQASRAWGATGATSNPVIVAGLINTGRYNQAIREAIEQGNHDDQIAWKLTDQIVRDAQELFYPVWQSTAGNDGYVSFEVDPLIEDPELDLSLSQRIERYLELATQWGAGHSNRMIKVPATPAGIASLEELTAAGLTLNVTLIFTPTQYVLARDAIWRGAQRRNTLEHFKSVYSVFISRIDQYTQKHLPQLAAAQGAVGILNAKQIWRLNRQHWAEHPTPLDQEIVFASTGTKLPNDPPDKYVAALAGGDIQTNPPATNQAVQDSGKTYSAQLDHQPDPAIVQEIDQQVDLAHLEEVLMEEGVRKFVQPQRALLATIAKQRADLG